MVGTGVGDEQASPPALTPNEVGSSAPLHQTARHAGCKHRLPPAAASSAQLTSSIFPGLASVGVKVALLKPSTCGSP